MLSEVGLITRTLSKNSIGQEVATETTLTVPCDEKEVTRYDWSFAGRNNRNLSHVLVINPINYSGQIEADYLGERYSIYRTYKSSLVKMELYLERKGGLRSE